MTLRAVSIAPLSYKNLAEMDRALVDANAKGGAGVIFTGQGPNLANVLDLQVTAAAGHNFQVATGKAVVREQTSPAIRGAYFAQEDALEVFALHAPDTLPFIDTVIFRVADASYGTVQASLANTLTNGQQGPRIDVVKGTPASAPNAVSDATINAQSVPGGWIRLADIRVNVADTGAVPVGQFTDTRRPGGFGRINTLSTTRPLLPLDGMEIYDLDTKANGTYNASVARWMVYDTEWQGYTPIWTANGVAVGGPGAGGSITGRYMRRGRTCLLNMYVSVGGSGFSGGSGLWLFSFPPGAPAQLENATMPARVNSPNAGGMFSGFAALYDSTTFAIYMPYNSTTGTHFAVQNADVTSAAGTGIPRVAGAYTFFNSGNFHVLGEYLMAL